MAKRTSSILHLEASRDDCLVFLAHYLDDFVAKTDPDKLASILAKIWNKMSPSGRDAALKLTLPPAIPGLLEQGRARFRGNR